MTEFGGVRNAIILSLIAGLDPAIQTTDAVRAALDPPVEPEDEGI
jgi:hypothetical protein